MFSTRLPISKSTSSCTNPFVTVPSVLITNITVAFVFHSFFLFFRKEWVFFLSFRFLWILTCGLPEQEVHYSAVYNFRFFTLHFCLLWQFFHKSFWSKNHRYFVFLSGYFKKRLVSFPLEFSSCSSVMLPAGIFVNNLFNFLVYTLTFSSFGF